MLHRPPIALVAAGLIAMAGCSGGTTQAPATSSVPDTTFRIGVMTGTLAQGEESFRAGEQVERAYPRRVRHITFPDNFPSEVETVVAQLSGLAADPAVRVILVAEAIPGSVTAARRIRASRPDLLIGFVNAHEDPDSVDRTCDLAIRRDQIAESDTSGQTPSNPLDMVAIRASANLLVDAVERKADLRDSATVLRYLEAQAGGPVRIRRHDPQGNQWLITMAHVAY